MSWSNNVRPKLKLVIVEDTPQQLEAFVRDYKALGYEVCGLLAAKPGAESIAYTEGKSFCHATISSEDDLATRLREQQPDLLLTDGNLTEGDSIIKDGEMVVKTAARIYPNMPIVMHSTSFNMFPPDHQMLIQCEREGYRPMRKFHPEEVHAHFQSFRGAARSA